MRAVVYDVPGGGYAEKVAAPARCIIKTPDRLSDIEAGGLPEVFLATFLDLFLVGWNRVVRR